MAGRIGVDDEDGTRLVHRTSEDDCTKFDRPKTRFVEIGNGQVEMNLLRPPVWPLWREIRRCPLKGQLERRPADMHLAPLRITDIQAPIQKGRVKGRKG